MLSTESTYSPNILFLFISSSFSFPLTSKKVIFYALVCSCTRSLVALEECGTECWGTYSRRLLLELTVAQIVPLSLWTNTSAKWINASVNPIKTMYLVDSQYLATYPSSGSQTQAHWFLMKIWIFKKKLNYFLNLLGTDFLQMLLKQEQIMPLFKTVLHNCFGTLINRLTHLE